ncbi:helix-turn-helix domain-containing protein [Rhizobium ruizarguesonis]|uniref:helix-turn-helix domain-containing protein n=1 Tax=Rhizobium ruizarguesonis TaxID=2081791 RepID=UPI002479BB14|nr:helix-turn-helix domain-containing protein [Rhizobium ruizarguesonis]
MLQATHFHPALEIANAALLGSEPNCLQALFREQPVEHLAAGQSLFFEGDVAKHLFEVVEGNLRIFRIISELPMTRLDMADYLGLTIETVSRTMTKLTTKGVLMAAGRHCVRIMKYATLVQLSGDDAEYVATNAA